MINLYKYFTRADFYDRSRKTAETAGGNVWFCQTARFIQSCLHNYGRRMDHRRARFLIWRLGNIVRKNLFFKNRRPKIQNFVFCSKPSESTPQCGHFAPLIVRNGSRSSENKQIEVWKLEIHGFSIVPSLAVCKSKQIGLQVFEFCRPHHRYFAPFLFKFGTD